ncbi:hypothetical protein ACIQ7D_10030 [Streptomyces sp. NPDC096310]|uniref:hypothetical protein n=1 Tax=Streptomyces sp. NPDC096310 TaxID=3366082 RepID=UPI0037F60CB9
MPPLSSPPGPQVDPAADERQFVPPRAYRGAGSGAAVAYTAFCHSHWPVYQRYAGAVTGCHAAGVELARAALRELGVQWPTALRSDVPSALGWALLCAMTAPRRTVTLRTLLRNLCVREVDALILRYKLGLTVRQAGYAMGMAPEVVEVLRRNALRKAAGLGRESHMPGSNAVRLRRCAPEHFLPPRRQDSSE